VYSGACQLVKGTTLVFSGQIQTQRDYPQNRITFHVLNAEAGFSLDELITPGLLLKALY